MRTIKFRMWDTQKKKMLEDVCPCYDDDSHIHMQYTGLKDKKGKEIYESDIVTWTVETKYGSPVGTQIREIKWTSGKNREGWNIASLSKKCKVVGNIYETPELRRK